MTQTLQGQIGRYIRIQWLLGVVLALLAVGFYTLGYRPNTSRLQDMRSEISNKRRMLDASQDRARTLPAVAMQVDDLRTRLDGFDKKLPRQQDLGPFIKDITQLSQQSSLRKLVVQPGMPRRTDQFSELPISMTFEGDFLNVFSFLRQIEEMQRLTRVRKLSVRSRDSKIGQVEVQLSMNIYFSEE